MPESNSNTPRSPLQRNARLYDKWSNVHVFNGVWIGWLLPLPVAIVLMVLYEPFEVFILSPLLMKRGIVFGYEALPNSLSDIFFDCIGIIIGYAGITAAVGSPVHVLHALGL